MKGEEWQRGEVERMERGDGSHGLIRALARPTLLLSLIEDNTKAPDSYAPAYTRPCACSMYHPVP